MLVVLSVALSINHRAVALKLTKNENKPPAIPTVVRTIFSIACVGARMQDFFFKGFLLERVIEYRPCHPLIDAWCGLDVTVLLLPPHLGTGSAPHGALSAS